MKRNHISLIIFLIGLSIIAYPWISKPMTIIEEGNAMEEYYDMVEELTPELEEELIEEYEYYNSILAEEDIDSEDKNILAGSDKEVFEGRLLGTIEIPKLKVKIPVYQGATVDNLRKGAGHISGTSLPTGELGTHSVLAGHNRYRNRELFTRVHKLELGDNFKVESLGKNMEYKVVQKIIVEPYETDYLMPVKGKDKVTLLTCTNFGKKRLLIMGERKD